MFFATTLPLQANSTVPPLQVVDYVDVERYLGLWYEIASIPQRFQKGCINSSAEYSQLDESTLRVVNRCDKKGPRGKLRPKKARGKAWIVDTETNAKLKVQFFWPFSGDYWIIELGDEYDYAVVGHPKREYLWILSRTKFMEDSLYNELLERIETTHGYDLDKIKRSTQQ